MKNKLEKQLRSFIDFDYSKRTIDRFHRWMISSDSAEEKETALRNLWFKTKGKAEHDMEFRFGRYWIKSELNTLQWLQM